jgi:tetratricopeptide (TPR) repeat protein
LPEEVVEHIVDKTDGVPLYVEELTKAILESDYLREETERYTLVGSLSEVAIPATLQDSLMARLDRLPTLREVAQLGAVLGREFAYEMIQYLAPLEEPVLQNGLGQLVENELLYQRGRPPRSRYIFKHALIQDAAYQSLLKRTRQQYHRQVAALIEERFPETVEAHPDLVAHHYTEAGNVERAVHYWRKAGERAAALSSGLEACNHFERSLTLLETFPSGKDRDATELSLRLGHAWALQLTRGPADAELGDTYAKALDLSETVAEPAQRVAAMFGMWRHNIWRSGPRAAVPNSDGLWSICERSESVSDRVLANYVRASTQMLLGDEDAGAANAQIAWELFKDSAKDSLTYRLGHNQGVISLLILAWSQWALGRPAAARSTIEEALVQAQTMSEPLTLTIVRVMAAAVFELLGEERPDNVDAARALTSEYGFTAWAGYADTCLGWLKHRAGATEEGLELMEGGIEAWRAASIKLFATDRLALYGRMCLEAGQLDRARQVLTESERLADETGEKFWLTEIQRYLGTLALAENGDREAAEVYFRRALGSAEARGAFGFALRAAIDLARHLDDSGQSAEANEILSGIYARFNADDATSDLRAAKALLNGLA